MPKVSIGLPVYNGEQFIEDSVNSIIEQTFADFELIICDNVSNDNTENICREFCRSDNRINYFRNAKNIGAAPNFNKVFQLSKGEYFKWCSHDDMHAPTFIEKCVHILDLDSSVVLAFPKTEFIDDENKKIEKYLKVLPTDSFDPAVRFRCLIPFGTMCNQIFGLFRRQLLEQTPLIGSYARGDNILLTRVALKGRFKEIDEYLFFRRRHAEQSARMVSDFRKWTVWFNPQTKNKPLFPYWTIWKEYIKVIAQSELTNFNKLRCFASLAKWTSNYKRILIRDLMYYWT